MEIYYIEEKHLYCVRKYTKGTYQYYVRSSTYPPHNVFKEMEVNLYLSSSWLFPVEQATKWMSEISLYEHVDDLRYKATFIQKLFGCVEIHQEGSCFYIREWVGGLKGHWQYFDRQSEQFEGMSTSFLERNALSFSAEEIDKLLDSIIQKIEKLKFKN